MTVCPSVQSHTSVTYSLADGFPFSPQLPLVTLQSLFLSEMTMTVLKMYTIVSLDPNTTLKCRSHLMNLQRSALGPKTFEIEKSPSWTPYPFKSPKCSNF